MRVIPRCLRQWDNRIHGKYCVCIKHPAQFVQYRVAVVFVGESEPREFFFGWLKLCKLGRSAFNRHLVFNQGALEAARET